MMSKSYYSHAGITLLLGDAEEHMAALEAGSFDLIITSPPYNLGISSGGGVRQKCDDPGSKWRFCDLREGYAGHTDDLPLPEYEEWQQRCLAEMWRLTAADGAIFYNHKPRIQDRSLWLPLALNPGLPLRQIIVWARNGGFNATVSQYMPVHEWILVLAKDRFRLRDQRASGVGDVWSFPADNGNEHPAPFPLALPSRILETTTGRRVLDPFVGSGSTLVAAKQHGREAVGIDNCEAYLEMAARRLSQEVLPLSEGYEASGRTGERTERWRRQVARSKREVPSTP